MPSGTATGTRGGSAGRTGLDSPVLRSAVALLALSGWLVAIFTGATLGGAAHLLLAGALAAFPWRAVRG